MKYSTISTLSALLFGVTAVSAQTTTATATTIPSGYVTHIISPGFNMLGLTVHNPVLLSGLLGQPAGEELPTDVADLSVALGNSTADSMVIIEITGGDNDGTVIEALSWSAAKFTGISGLDASLSGDTFQVRMAPSISDLFGASNSAGFQAGDLQTADLIWISGGDGSFNKYYYSLGDPNAFPVPVVEGWKNSLGGDASNVRLNYMDGIFIQRPVANWCVSTETLVAMIRDVAEGGN